MQKLSTPTLRALTVLGVSLTMLLSYNFMSAAWTNAPANPPANNTLAPINVGTSTASIQNAGQGALQFDFLGARDTVVANGAVRSNAYCDLDGKHCFGAATTSNPIIELGVINVETSGLTMQANNQCIEHGYTGLWAFTDYSGNEDVICFRSSMTKFNTVFLDGTKMYAIIRAQNPSLPIDVYTTYGGDAEERTLCTAALPGSVPISRTNGSYDSPGDNSVVHLDAGVWTIVGADDFNFSVDTLTCQKNFTGETYYWAMGDWSSCPVDPLQCGWQYGTQTKTGVCHNANGAVVSDSMCPGAKPVQSQSCSSYDHSCH